MSAVNCENLKQQLIKFGLNPKQWAMRPAGPNMFILKNRLTSMTMLGLAFSTGAMVGWTSLELRSL